MARPQKRPQPESWAGGVPGQADGRSWGAESRERRAAGVRVNSTPSGQAPWLRRPARPVAVHTRQVEASRKARDADQQTVGYAALGGCRAGRGSRAPGVRRPSQATVDVDSG